jgi:hypothetical protein
MVIYPIVTAPFDPRHPRIDYLWGPLVIGGPFILIGGLLTLIGISAGRR